MLIALILMLISAAYMIAVTLVALGLYKDPILRHFERYAERDDSVHLLPYALAGIGLLAFSGGFLFSAAVAPRYPPLLLGLFFLGLSYAAREYREKLAAYPQIFLSFPRWYVELRQRTTREERRRIAYMWLCLPPRMRLHLNGSDRHFLHWADLVILGTVTQTVEDQEATTESTTYIPDLYGRWG